VVYSPASLLNPVDDMDGTPKLGVPLLYIVRHAQNDDDAQGKIRGLKDQPINECGQKQLDSLRDFFSERPVAAVLADDLSRTRATAMAVALTCGVAVETDLGLRSWDLGSLEGKSMEAHKLEIQDFKTHPHKVPVGGQSWADFKRVALDTINRSVRRAMEMSGPLCLVTHGSFIQIFFEEYGDWPSESAYDHTPVDQAGVAALYLTRNGTELRILKGAKDSPDE